MINEFDKYKPKNTGIKFEDIKLKKVYAFTFNPKDSGDTRAQLLLRQDAYVLREIKGILSSLSHALKSATITTKIESSPTGRIHCHAFLTINNYIDWVSEIRMLTNLGTVCIKEITSDDWEEYCSKQDHIWQPYFAKHNLAYPYKVPIPDRFDDADD